MFYKTFKYYMKLVYRLQISLLLSFSMVSFCSLATFYSDSYWYVSLSSIIFFSLMSVLSSCSFFLRLSSSPSTLFLEPTALNLASSIFYACVSRTSINVETMSLKPTIFFKKSIHSPLRFSVSLYLSAARTLI
jgi:hypothetical protein